MLTIHSGVGGEGEALRLALEGSGIDEAGLEISQIRANMSALRGSTASLALGEKSLGDLELIALDRIPAMDVPHYFGIPFDSALRAVASDNPDLQDALASGSPLLMFEICGWHVPGEVWNEGGSTSASIYLGTFRLR